MRRASSPRSPVGILFAALMLFQHVVSCGTIKGTVTDAQTGQPLVGANVVLLGLKERAVADVSGVFVFPDVPAGHFTVRAVFIGYLPARAAVTVARDEDETEVNFPLRPEGSQAPDPPARPDSASSPAASRGSAALSIAIDTLYCNAESRFFALVSCRNAGADPAFLLRSYLCLPRMRALVADGRGRLDTCVAVTANSFRDKCRYDESDLIEIPPGSHVQFPLMELSSRTVGLSCKGSYSVRVVYSYEGDPRVLHDPVDRGKRGGQIEATRGSFLSENIVQWRGGINEP